MKRLREKHRRAPRTGSGRHYYSHNAFCLFRIFLQKQPEIVTSLELFGIGKKEANKKLSRCVTFVTGGKHERLDYCNEEMCVALVRVCRNKSKVTNICFTIPCILHLVTICMYLICCTCHFLLHCKI